MISTVIISDFPSQVLFLLSDASLIYPFPRSRLVYSAASLVNSASFSCWALMNDSLKRLASDSTGQQFPIAPKKERGVRTFAVGEPNSQSLRLWLSLTDIRSCVPDPASVTANVGR